MLSLYLDLYQVFFLRQTLLQQFQQPVGIVPQLFHSHRQPTMVALQSQSTLSQPRLADSLHLLHHRQLQ